MLSFLSSLTSSLGFNKVQEVHQSTKAKNAKEENLNKDNIQTQKTQQTKSDTNNTTKKSFKEILNEAQDKVIISEEGKKSVENKKVNEDEPEIKEKPLLCNHDPNAKDSTLVILPKRIMSYPPEVFMCCDVCRMGFRFVKNEDGSYGSKS